MGTVIHIRDVLVERSYLTLKTHAGAGMNLLKMLQFITRRDMPGPFWERQLFLHTRVEGSDIMRPLSEYRQEMRDLVARGLLARAQTPGDYIVTPLGFDVVTHLFGRLPLIDRPMQRSEYHFDEYVLCDVGEITLHRRAGRLSGCTLQTWDGSPGRCVITRFRTCSELMKHLERNQLVDAFLDDTSRDLTAHQAFDARVSGYMVPTRRAA